MPAPTPTKPQVGNTWTVPGGCEEDSVWWFALADVSHYSEVLIFFDAGILAAWTEG